MFQLEPFKSKPDFENDKEQSGTANIDWKAKPLQILRADFHKFKSSFSEKVPSFTNLKDLTQKLTKSKSVDLLSPSTPKIGKLPKFKTIDVEEFS